LKLAEFVCSAKCEFCIHYKTLMPLIKYNCILYKIRIPMIQWTNNSNDWYILLSVLFPFGFPFLPFRLESQIRGALSPTCYFYLNIWMSRWLLPINHAGLLYQKQAKLQCMPNEEWVQAFCKCLCEVLSHFPCIFSHNSL